MRRTVWFRTLWNKRPPFLKTFAIHLKPIPNKNKKKIRTKKFWNRPDNMAAKTFSLLRVASNCRDYCRDQSNLNPDMSQNRLHAVCCGPL